MCDGIKKFIKLDISTTKNVSFEDVIVQFKPLVESIVSSWPTYDKDDLRQVCNIGLWKSFEAYNLDKETTFGFFAKKVILHDIYQFVKKNKRVSISINESEDSTQYFNNIKDESINNNIEENTTYELFLSEYINCLPLKYKALFKMYFIDNLNQIQIAEFLNCTQPAISYQLKKISSYVKRMYQVDSVLSYVPVSIRTFVKKSFILDNTNVYLRTTSLNGMTAILNGLQITIDKIENNENIHYSILSWLTDTYFNLNERVELLDLKEDITSIDVDVMESNLQFEGDQLDLFAMLEAVTLDIAI